MDFFKNIFNKPPDKKKLIFIVEDDAIYANTVKAAIKNKFPEIEEIKIFPVGELCIDNLHLNPDVIIMDYFLNSRFEDAQDGLEIIKQIRATHKEVNIIVLSSQKDIKIMVDALTSFNCIYIRKDVNAFEKIEKCISEIFTKSQKS